VFGEPTEVTGVLAQVYDLEIDTEEIAAAIVRLEDGAVIEVHVDYLQRHPQSRIDVIGAEGQLVFDGTRLAWRRAGEAEWTEERIAVAVNEMYVAEISEFCDCVSNGRPPALDGAEGRATLALAAAVRESATTGRRVRLATDGVQVLEVRS
jgi:predicted dehydrogenase